jgi:hypothetical protein
VISLSAGINVLIYMHDIVCVQDTITPAAEQLCTRWLLHYEAYRTWQEFRRSGRANYATQRGFMPTVRQVKHPFLLFWQPMARLGITHTTNS